MVDRTLLLLLMGLLVPLAGCAMCDCPYDYAGPTYTPASGEPPRPDYRAGSVLSGGGFVPAATSTVTTGQPTPVESPPSRDGMFDDEFNLMPDYPSGTATDTPGLNPSTDGLPDF